MSVCSCICLSTYLYTHLPTCISTNLLMYLFTYLSTHHFVYLPIHPPTIYTLIHLPSHYLDTHLFICSSSYLATYPFTHWSTCSSIYPSALSPPSHSFTHPSCYLPFISPIYPYICSSPQIFTSIHLSTHQPTHSVTYFLIRPPTYQCIGPSIHLSTNPSSHHRFTIHSTIHVHPFIYLFIHPSYPQTYIYPSSHLVT